MATKKKIKAEKAAKKLTKVLSLEALGDVIVKALAGEKATARQIGTKTAYFEFRVPKDNRGQAIGKGGEHIKAIETILIAAARKTKTFIKDVSVLDEKKTK